MPHRKLWTRCGFLGEQAEVQCTPQLAYGEKGAPPLIPPGAPLVFTLELLKLQEGPAQLVANGLHPV